MPTCIATVGLSLGDIKNSVTSLMGSVSYLKAFIPIAVTNIIHNRISYDSQLFDPHKLNNVPYKTFSKRIPRKHELFNVYHWMRAALGDLDKKYMKELYLIVRKKDTEEIIEHYCFSINYTEVDGKPKVKLDEDKVLQTTSKLFETINVLGLQDKLDEANVSFAMQVVLNEEAPDTYVTKSFERSDPFVEPETRDTISVGVVSTGYHKLKILAKGKVFNIDDETTSHDNFENTEITTQAIDELDMEAHKTNHVDNIGPNPTEILDTISKEVIEDEDFVTTDNYRKTNAKKRKSVDAKNKNKKVPKKSNVNKKKVGVKCLNNGESSQDNTNSFNQPDLISNQEIKVPYNKNVNIYCLCTISYDINHIQLILCSLCGNYQHVACVGYRSITSVPKPHICYFCHSKTGAKISDIRMYNARSENMRFSIAFLRLICVYCNNTQESPEHIINLVSINLQQHAYQELIKYGVINKINGVITTNMAKISTALNSVVFYKEADSMELESSEVIDIDEY